MYTTLIVDDEIQQQEILTDMLGKNFPGYQIAGICSGVDEGLQKIQQLKPQLVFLDVVMPPKNGFDLLEELKEINFEIIFTTSHEQFAIRAFKVSAVDYLLKPFGEIELSMAVEKFEQRVAQKSSVQHIQTLLHNINSRTVDKIKIALPTVQGYLFAEVGNIIRCESDNTYTIFYFADRGRILVSKSMKDCEELLEQYGFFRTHTSHLVNMRFVKEYIKGDGGYVKMADGSTVDVSRQRKNDFIQSFQKL